MTDTTLVGRRDLLRAGALLIAPAMRSARAWGTGFEETPGFGEGEAGRRRYRIDARILLLSIPVYRRSDVGEGAAVWVEHETAGLYRSEIEFAAGSRPERAAGLNRFGFLRETSALRGGQPAEYEFFGLMTSSTEQTAEEGRQALRHGRDQATYTAIESRAHDDVVETATARFEGSPAASLQRRDELLRKAHDALASAPRRRQRPAGGQPPPRPFLHALAAALRSGARGDFGYLYNGRNYRMRLRPEPDPAAARHFRRAGLIGPRAEVVRVAGRLWAEPQGKPQDFRLWLEAGAGRPIPLRIEYQPRAFLRLQLECVA